MKTNNYKKIKKIIGASSIGLITTVAVIAQQCNTTNGEFNEAQQTVFSAISELSAYRAGSSQVLSPNTTEIFNSILGFGRAQGQRFDVISSISFAALTRDNVTISRDASRITITEDVEIRFSFSDPILSDDYTDYQSINTGLMISGISVNNNLITNGGQTSGLFYDNSPNSAAVNLITDSIQEVADLNTDPSSLSPSSLVFYNAILMGIQSSISVPNPTVATISLELRDGITEITPLFNREYTSFSITQYTVIVRAYTADQVETVYNDLENIFEISNIAINDGEITSADNVTTLNATQNNFDTLQGAANSLGSGIFSRNSSPISNAIYAWINSFLGETVTIVSIETTSSLIIVNPDATSIRFLTNSIVVTITDEAAATRVFMVPTGDEMVISNISVISGLVYNGFDNGPILVAGTNGAEPLVEMIP